VAPANTAVAAKPAADVRTIFIGSRCDDSYLYPLRLSSARRVTLYCRKVHRPRTRRGWAHAAPSTSTCALPTAAAGWSKSEALRPFRQFAVLTGLVLSPLSE